MKKCFNVLTALLIVLVVSFVLSYSTAFAQILPFLITDGNYTYTNNGDGTGSLTFSSVNPTWATYTDGSSGCPPYYCANADAVISTDWSGFGTLTSEISFGTLTNSSGSPTLFGSASLSVYEIATGDVFFSATIDNFDTSLNWMPLSGITAGSAQTTYNSRYVSELLSNGNGYGGIQISFTPQGGGTEYFSETSSGSVGITIAAAPEPISAILFLSGGATLAVRRFRRQK